MSIPTMIPYASPKYFVYLVFALLPMIVMLLWKGTRWTWYQNLVTVFFLVVSFGGNHWHQGIALIGYVLWQVLCVGCYFSYHQRKNQTSVFCLAVCASLLPLIVSKLVPFFQAGNESIVSFLGISYLTFKSVQLMMEIRDGVLKEYCVGDYIQFLLFFPTISSGPIDRYRRFLKDFRQPPKPEVYLDYLAKGIHAIFMGFLYKFILGYYLGAVLLPQVQALALAQGAKLSWPLIGYMYVYSLYLFFDFAGYSLFAVGTSQLMGYNVPVNFNKPFLSGNIKEFWNRWHMTLSFWFRDYVYMRLMFMFIKKKVFKSRVIASNVAYVALFGLMGIWHGLTWYYIVYGIYHALLICLTDAWLRYKKKQKALPSNGFTRGLAIVFTFHAVCVSFLIFSGFLDTLFFN